MLMAVPVDYSFRYYKSVEFLAIFAVASPDDGPVDCTAASTYMLLQV
jgi:hypothetical protein